ncbi:MAG TPA: transporter [Stenotrophomonas sp.]|nr:transporter [Stenotrophomonas sp.]
MAAQVIRDASFDPHQSTALDPNMAPVRLLHASLALLGFIAHPAFAQSSSQTAATSTDEIARKLADPGAAMISVPFQYNYSGDVGPGGAYHNQQLKVQPVIPFVGENGKFLLRPILPLASNQFPEDKSGMGDLFVQGYYIPNGQGATEFGFGPAALLKTATSDSLGTGKWSLGPALVMIHKTASKKWTLGALANHVWSIAGDHDRDDVSLTNFQPFATRNLPGGWSASFTSETSYNWKASSGDRWTVPLGATVSKVVMLGHMPVSFGLGGFYNVERPEYANRWLARFSVTLAFPE